MELHRPIGRTLDRWRIRWPAARPRSASTTCRSLRPALEHAQTRSQAIGFGTAEEARLFVDRLAGSRPPHQPAAGFLKQPAPELLARGRARDRIGAPPEAATAAADLPPATGVGEFDAGAPGSSASTSTPCWPADSPSRCPPAVHAVQHQPGHDRLLARSDARLPSASPNSSHSPSCPARPCASLPLAERDRDQRHRGHRRGRRGRRRAVPRSSRKKGEGTAATSQPSCATGHAAWRGQPCGGPHARCTLKGGARGPGAMRQGEMAHRPRDPASAAAGRPAGGGADVERLRSPRRRPDAGVRGCCARARRPTPRRPATVAAEPPAEPVLSVTAMPPARRTGRDRRRSACRWLSCVPVPAEPVAPMPQQAAHRCLRLSTGRASH